jgi:lysozyme family protein
MANYLIPVPFIRKREGGLSNDFNDSASSDMCPYYHFGVQYHTSNGWSWREWSEIKGVTPDSASLWFSLSIPSMYDATNQNWADLFKQYYWDKLLLDSVDYQPLANLLADWAFNAGVESALSHFEAIIGVKLPDVIGVNENDVALLPSQTYIYKTLLTIREKFYEILAAKYPKDEEFLNGWEKRVQDLIAFNQALEVHI